LYHREVGFFRDLPDPPAAHSRSYDYYSFTFESVIIKNGTLIPYFKKAFSIEKLRYVV